LTNIQITKRASGVSQGSLCQNNPEDVMNRAAIVQIAAFVGMSVWLVSVNFFFFGLFLAGFVIGTLIFLFSKSARVAWGILLVVGIIGVSSALWFFQTPSAYDPGRIGTVSEYDAVITLPDEHSADWEVEESAKVTEEPPLPHPLKKEKPAERKDYRLTVKRGVRAEKQGLFVWNAHFRPLDISVLTSNDSIKKDGVAARKEDFEKDGKPGRFVFESKGALIEVRDIPAGTFCRAKDRTADIAPFKEGKKNTERASWKLDRLSQDQPILPFQGSVR
jgi:hypothetical protein